MVIKLADNQVAFRPGDVIRGEVVVENYETDFQATSLNISIIGFESFSTDTRYDTRILVFQQQPIAKFASAPSSAK